jgi:hypothetical protein
VVAGRIGDNNQHGEPYSAIVKASTGSTRCDDSCARDASGDGYTACYPYGGTAITVWRQLTTTPEISFESDTAGFASVAGIPATMRLTLGEWNSIVVPVPSDFALSGSTIGLVFNVSGAGTLYVYVDAISFDG